MKVAQIMLARGFGGAERHFIDLCRGLAARGDAVLAICHPAFSALAELHDIDGVNIQTVRALGPWDRLAGLRISRALAAFRPAAVQVHLARAAGLGAPAAAALGIPVCANTHNFIKLKYYRAVDHFIAPTTRLVDYLTGNRISAERVSFIPHFTSAPAAPPSPTSPSGKTTLVALGRLVEKKGYAVLLDALARLAADGPVPHLILAGDGPERSALEQQAGALGLAAHVEFRGWVSDPHTLLGDGGIFVIPSLLEPFGIVVLEAMAAGLPVVSSRSDGPLEILNEDCAWFADVGDADSLAAALRAALGDPAARQQKAAAALARFRDEYSDDVMIPRYQDLYARMAAARNNER